MIKIKYDFICIGMLTYLLIINIINFALMGVDKGRARRHEWRVPEKRFFVLAILGGAIGAFAGMYGFRHKTRHWYFVIGMPFLVVVNVLTAAFIVRLRCNIF